MLKFLWVLCNPSLLDVMPSVVLITGETYLCTTAAIEECFAKVGQRGWQPGTLETLFSSGKTYSSAASGYQGPTASRSNSTGGSQFFFFWTKVVCFFFFPGAAWGSGELLIDARQCIPKERLLIFVFSCYCWATKEVTKRFPIDKLANQTSACLLVFASIFWDEMLLWCFRAQGRIVNARPEADRHREEVQLRLTKGQPGYFCISECCGVVVVGAALCLSTAVLCHSEIVFQFDRITKMSGESMAER